MPPLPPVPTLIVFDLGGIVIRIVRSWQEACAAAGLPFRDRIASPELVAARQTIHHEYECGRIPCERFFAAIADSTQDLYTADEFRRIHDAWIIDEYPGVARLIHALRNAGLATGVLSNTNASHWRRLARVNGEPPEYTTPSLVDYLHASHLLGLAKPDLEIHREFERRIRTAGWRGRSEEILFFEDTPKNVEGARAAGWQAELIDHAGDTATQMTECLRRRGIDPGPSDGQ